MNPTLSLLALFTGMLTGAAFAYLHVPIPAPPTLAGVLGIVGIYLGYKTIEFLNVGVDLVGALGI